MNMTSTYPEEDFTATLPSAEEGYDDPASVQDGPNALIPSWLIYPAEDGVLAAGQGGSGRGTTVVNLAALAERARYHAECGDAVGRSEPALANGLERLLAQGGDLCLQLQDGGDQSGRWLVTALQPAHTQGAAALRRAHALALAAQGLDQARDHLDRAGAEMDQAGLCPAVGQGLDHLAAQLNAFHAQLSEIQAHAQNRLPASSDGEEGGEAEEQAQEAARPRGRGR